MLKKTLSQIVNLISVILLIVISAAGASDASAEEEEMTIVGDVKFESRSTIVPMTICESEPCSKSKPYWSMVLHARDSRYELDQVFALGSTRAPESIELAGTIIRPGSHVELIAKVERVSRNYALVSEVKKVSILMDLHMDLQALLPTFYGWACHGTEGIEAKNSQIYADVFFAGDREESHEIYKLRVNAAVVGDDVSIYPIATIEDATSHSDGIRVIYSGRADRTKVELSIETSEGNPRFEDLPSTLKVHRKVYPLRCSRTRVWSF